MTTETWKLKSLFGTGGKDPKFYKQTGVEVLSTLSTTVDTGLNDIILKSIVHTNKAATPGVTTVTEVGGIITLSCAAADGLNKFDVEAIGY